MQVYPDKLAQTLTTSLQKVYLIFGDEPYQKYQALDQIRNAAFNQGFDERNSHVADQSFEWSRIIEATQSLSLFSAKQIIEVELPTGKPGKEGASILQEAISSGNEDTLLVLHGPKIGKDIQNTKWFKALDKEGVYIPCYPLEGRALTNWVQHTASQKNVMLTHQAANLLSEYCEGNMLAGAQEIEKLALNFPQQSIDAPDIEKVVVNQSRFNVFQLADAFLLGDGKKTTKLLLSLESEGLEPPIILWALTKEWQTLVELKSTSGPINWRTFRIWGTRQRLYEAALARLNMNDLTVIGRHLSNADSAFKSQSMSRPYVSLCYLCLLFVFPQLSQFEWEA